MSARRIFGAVVLTAAALIGGMPGSAGTNAAVVTRVAAPGESYAALLGKAIRWSEFPLRIYFTRDGEYSRERAAEAVGGFDQWVRVTKGLVRYEVVDSPARAQITVRFDSANDNGYTTTHYTTRGNIFRADMNLGVRRGDPVDVPFVAAHEFGHALGIDGHSDDQSDLMYPVHWSGTAAHITDRDLNTLSTSYPALAHRLAAGITR